MAWRSAQPLPCPNGGLEGHPCGGFDPTRTTHSRRDPVIAADRLTCPDRSSNPLRPAVSGRGRVIERRRSSAGRTERPVPCGRSMWPVHVACAYTGGNFRSRYTPRPAPTADHPSLDGAATGRAMRISAFSEPGPGTSARGRRSRRRRGFVRAVALTRNSAYVPTPSDHSDASIRPRHVPSLVIASAFY